MLEVGVCYARVFRGEMNDLAVLLFIDAAYYSGNQSDVESYRSEPFERLQLLFQDVRFSADNPVGLGIKTVELKVQRRAYLIQFSEESIVLRNALSVRINHHERYASALRCPHKV